MVASYVSFGREDWRNQVGIGEGHKLTEFLLAIRHCEHLLPLTFFPSHSGLVLLFSSLAAVEFSLASVAVLSLFRGAGYGFLNVGVAVSLFRGAGGGVESRVVQQQRTSSFFLFE